MPFLILVLLTFGCQTPEPRYRWQPTLLRYSGKSSPSKLFLVGKPLLEFSPGSELLWEGKKSLYIKSVGFRKGVILTEKIELISLVSGKRDLILRNIVWHSQLKKNTIIATVRKYQNMQQHEYYSVPKTLVKIQFPEKRNDLKIVDIETHECLPDIGELELHGKIMVQCPP